MIEILLIIILALTSVKRASCFEIGAVKQTSNPINNILSLSNPLSKMPQIIGTSNIEFSKAFFASAYSNLIFMISEATF